jgi:hypothetical protein
MPFSFFYYYQCERHELELAVWAHTIFLITHTHLYLRYSIKILICDKCQILKVQHITCELILSYKIHKMVYINTFVVDLQLHAKH